ncbi:MAG TPA: hypothetical protein VFR68_04080 [Candidatus Dormibacteraeota bacterium]|nr:hypothetical protein [Candidatus Dormibacteraeota bacterium]
MRAIIAVAGATIVGCNSNPSTTGNGANGGDGTPAYGIFSGHLDLHGEIAVHGTFTDTLTSRRETCRAYVGGAVPATTLWVVPTPSNASPVGGHVVTLTGGVPTDQPSSGYHGPGTYAQPSAAVAVLIVDNASFLPGNDARVSITVSPDGSGSMSFTGMVDTSTSAAESGEERWTCKG